MKKSLEISDPRSCLSRAGEDEYVFVLRSKDPAAARTIRYWAQLRVDLGKNDPADPQIAGALADAEALDEAHRQDAAAELPDEPAAPTPRATPRWLRRVAAETAGAGAPDPRRLAHRLGAHLPVDDLLAAVASTVEAALRRIGGLPAIPDEGYGEAIAPEVTWAVAYTLLGHDPAGLGHPLRAELPPGDPVRLPDLLYLVGISPSPRAGEDAIVGGAVFVDGDRVPPDLRSMPRARLAGVTLRLGRHLVALGAP